MIIKRIFLTSKNNIIKRNFYRPIENPDKFVNDLKPSKKYNVQFFERDTGFDFPVKIKKLKKIDSEWQCTFWHNLMFNPSLNDNIEVLLFIPVKSELKINS